MRGNFPIAGYPIVTRLDDQGISRKISAAIHAEYSARHQSGSAGEGGAGAFACEPLTKPYILNFLFQCQSESVLHARLQIGDNFAQLACRTLTLVVDQVGVILGQARPAQAE